MLFDCFGGDEIELDVGGKTNINLFLLINFTHRRSMYILQVRYFSAAGAYFLPSA